jgi:hypothetical protein
MYRVYNYNKQIIFTHNCNSPVGYAIGMILETDANVWSFFAKTSDPFSLEAMSAITDKLKDLHSENAQDVSSNQLTFSSDDF